MASEMDEQIEKMEKNDDKKWKCKISGADEMKKDETNKRHPNENFHGNACLFLVNIYL